VLTQNNTAVGEFLQKLQVYKATADVEEGTKFFSGMSMVGLDYWGSTVRAVVMKSKQPRKIFVQPNTCLDETTGIVSLKEYEPSLEGLIQSWADRDV